MLLRRRRRSAVASAVAARLLWLLNGAAVASEDAAMMVLLLLLPPLLLRSLAAWACCARVPKGLAPAPAPAPNVGAAAPNAVPRGAPNELPPPNPALLPAPNPPPKFMVWRSKFSDSHDGERGGARRRARQGHGFTPPRLRLTTFFAAQDKASQGQNQVRSSGPTCTCTCNFGKKCVSQLITSWVDEAPFFGLAELTLLLQKRERLTA
jgi:hypothetical protein